MLLVRGTSWHFVVAFLDTMLSDSAVLVAFTRGCAVVYSLPALEAIHTFRLPVSANPRYDLLRFGVPPLISVLSIRDSIVCTAAGDILETFRSQQLVKSLVFTPLLSHSDSSASGTVNFRHHKYAKTTSIERSGSQAEVNVTPTLGSNISNWIKSFVEETPVTGDEIDQTRTPSQRKGLLRLLTHTLSYGATERCKDARNYQGANAISFKSCKY